MDLSPISSASFSLSTPPISRLPSSRSLLAMAGPCSSKYCFCPEGKFNYEHPAGPVSLCLECNHGLDYHSDRTNENLIAKSIQTPSVPSNVVRSSTHPNPFESERPFIHPENTDPCICTRSNTIENLYKELKAQRVLHVRGTPTSGKTVMGILLGSFISRNFPEMEIISFTWPTNLTADQNSKAFQGIIEGLQGRKFPTDPRKMSNVVLIIDEAQNSYNHFTLWNDLIKYQAQGAQGGAYIVLLSSYGSPSENTHEYKDDTSTPLFLSCTQRISLRPLEHNNQNVSLYFSRAEFYDIMNRASTTENSLSLPLILSEKLRDKLFELSCGHPGCTRAMLQVISQSQHTRKSRKNGTEITVDILENIMEDSKFWKSVMDAHGFGRSFPNPNELQNNPECSQVLEHAVVSGRVEGKNTKLKGLNFAYKKGWLHAELDNDGETSYIVPTYIHHMYYTRHLCRSGEDFPTKKFPSLHVFWREVVGGFLQTALATHQIPISTGGLPRPMEAQYADEFYRSAWKLLGEKIFLTSEWTGWGSSANSEGRIDFMIRDVMWGIELMRDGGGIGEHLDRFEPGGKYYEWVTKNKLKDWVVLDFRRTVPRKSNHRRIFHVVFNTAYSEYTVYDGFGMADKPARLRA